MVNEVITMSKTIEVPDIAMWEETDSELAKYSIQELTSLVSKFEEQNKQLVNAISNQDKKIEKAIEYIEQEPIDDEIEYTTRLLDILRGEDNE